jgi:hypothetical protein
MRDSALSATASTKPSYERVDPAGSAVLVVSVNSNPKP